MGKMLKEPNQGHSRPISIGCEAIQARQGRFKPAMRQGMKKRTLPRPSRFDKAVPWQVCQLIPTHLVAQLARACGAERRARTFSCWSQVVAMVYAQVAHALSLNDVCDALRLPPRSLRFGDRDAAALSDGGEQMFAESGTPVPRDWT